MTTPFIGEIQMFGFSFNPKNWAFCSGALMPIQQNTALFSLLGVTYGGNGVSVFQLPNFSGRAACHASLNQRPTLGETFGENQVTLTTEQIPGHSHAFNYFSPIDSSKRAPSPAAGYGLSPLTAASTRPFLPPGVTDTAFSPLMLQPSGSNQPHPNQQPYLAVNFCIALIGTYPSFG